MGKFEYCFFHVEHKGYNKNEKIGYSGELHFPNGGYGLSGKRLETILDDLGNDGWEMVGCGSLQQDLAVSHVVYFKRERKQ
jgi:hypothetical protein